MVSQAHSRLLRSIEHVLCFRWWMEKPLRGNPKAAALPHSTRGFATRKNTFCANGRRWNGRYAAIQRQLRCHTVLAASPLDETRSVLLVVGARAAMRQSRGSYAAA